MSYDSVWKLNEGNVEVVKEQENVGIVHDANTLEQSIAEMRIHAGRGSAYSLFHAGFNGPLA